MRHETLYFDLRQRNSSNPGNAQSYIVNIKVILIGLLLNYEYHHDKNLKNKNFKFKRVFKNLNIINISSINNGVVY